MVCGCGCGSPNPCVRGIALAGLQVLGLNGQSVYGYQAYADDAAGTGFTLTYTGTQTYRAILLSPVVIPTLLVTHFTGLFQKWTGDDGIPGAISREWLFDDATGAADPTAGKMRINNSDVTAATAIYISKTDGSAVAVGPLLALAALSTAAIKSYICVTKKTDNSKFALYSVSALTDNGAWDTLTIAYVSGSGAAPFTLADDLVFSISLPGAKGAAGMILIENDLSQSKKATLAGGASNVIKFTIPANTLVNDGDFCECDVDVIQNIDWTNGDTQLLTMYDNNDPGSNFFLSPQPIFGYYKLRWTVSRISATTYWATQEMHDDLTGGGHFMWGFKFTGGGFNFTTNAYEFTVDIRSVIVTAVASPYATIARSTIKYFPKV